MAMSGSFQDPGHFTAREGAHST